MRTMAVLLVLLLAMGLRPLCCDEATDGATPAACDLYCEWNGVDFRIGCLWPFGNGE